jgi:hypothetical protein
MRRVGDVLSTIFDNGLMEKVQEYSAFFSCWKDLAEKNGIAAASDHSWIKSLERGLVWIEVDHPGWKQILQTKESKLLSDFRRRFPEMDISGISIMLCRAGTRPVNTGIEPSAEPVMTEKHPHPPDLEPIPAAEGYDAIKEGTLKDTLMRLEQRIKNNET